MRIRLIFDLLGGLPLRVGGLVVAEFEKDFMSKCDRSLGAALTVAIPLSRVPLKNFLSGEAIENLQLDNVQTMVKRTSQHVQPSAGLLVKGPKADIVMVKIRCECTHRLFEQVFGTRITGC